MCHRVGGADPMHIALIAVAPAFAPAAYPAAAEPPPYTLNLDQSFTCPRDVNDAWYTGGTQHAAVLPNASAELAAVIDAVPAYAAFWSSIPRLASSRSASDAFAPHTRTGCWTPA